MEKDEHDLQDDNLQVLTTMVNHNEACRSKYSVHEEVCDSHGYHCVGE